LAYNTRSNLTDLLVCQTYKPLPFVGQRFFFTQMENQMSNWIQAYGRFLKLTPEERDYIKANLPDFTIEDDIAFVDDVNEDPEFVAAVQKFLAKFRPDEVFKLGWAYESGPDLGGGVWIITQDKKIIGHTDDFFRDEMEKLAKQF
jgi:hypothetical protein